MRKRINFTGRKKLVSEHIEIRVHNLLCVFGVAVGPILIAKDAKRKDHQIDFDAIPKHRIDERRVSFRLCSIEANDVDRDTARSQPHGIRLRSCDVAHGQHDASKPTGREGIDGGERDLRAATEHQYRLHIT